MIFDYQVGVFILFALPLIIGFTALGVIRIWKKKVDYRIPAALFWVTFIIEMVWIFK